MARDKNNSLPHSVALLRLLEILSDAYDDVGQLATRLTEVRQAFQEGPSAAIRGAVAAARLDATMLHAKLRLASEYLNQAGFEPDAQRMLSTSTLLCDCINKGGEKILANDVLSLEDVKTIFRGRANQLFDDIGEMDAANWAYMLPFSCRMYLEMELGVLKESVEALVSAVSASDTGVKAPHPASDSVSLARAAKERLDEIIEENWGYKAADFEDLTVDEQATGEAEELLTLAEAAWLAGDADPDTLRKPNKPQARYAGSGTRAALYHYQEMRAYIASDFRHRLHLMPADYNTARAKLDARPTQ
jgi:hypothetical protein